MKKFKAGNYEIKYKGRGAVIFTLTSNQAKVLFGLANKLEIEYIKLINFVGNCDYIHTGIKGRFYNIFNDMDFNR